MLFLDYVRMLRSSLTRGQRHLQPADTAFLQGRIDRDAWYPMDSFERLGLAILDEIVGHERDAIRLWGRGQVSTIIHFVPDLLAPGEPRDSVMRFGNFMGSLFDFPAITVDAVSDEDAAIVIDYGMSAPAEEAAAYQTMGFFEALVQEAGGAGLRAEFASASWLAPGRPTVLTLEWTRAPEVPAPTAPPRVLVVDDEPLVLAGLRRILERSAQVTCARSRREALAALEAGPFDVVIVDQELSEQATGLALLEEIAAHWPGTARILHTARMPESVPGDQARGVVHAVAVKPIELTELHRVIAQARRTARATLVSASGLRAAARP